MLHQSRTWQVICTICHKLKWPYLVEKPANPYVCTLCSLNTARQAAGRLSGKKAAAAKMARRTQQKASSAG